MSPVSAPDGCQVGRSAASSHFVGVVFGLGAHYPYEGTWITITNYYRIMPATDQSVRSGIWSNVA